ncbi:hypothetical protein DAPPUDRAFT_109353 [Daphnia pulex]|uniref:Uncharacterized protein n=1 Tax=Daphnia pulex TaxID=6669 RepID=E9H2S1_DAPPU|nr:hypothetical protein DAPPUDRAFT_109353 [Daphnia pulex]|eukprot:EFX73962.1 hypothetical protein DAPPUDRAFT_109353 [Daphnia pulex]
MKKGRRNDLVMLRNSSKTGKGISRQRDWPHGRNLRGNLPYLPAELEPKFVPSSLVRRELSARQTQVASLQAGFTSAQASAFRVGQAVQALVGNRWLCGMVNSVCPEPQSYVVHLDDGCLFRRTRWAINVDNETVCHRPRDPGVSGYPVSHTIAHDAQSVPFSARSAQSCPTLAVSNGCSELIMSTSSGGFCPSSACHVQSFLFFFLPVVGPDCLIG